MLSIDLSMTLICAPSAHAHFMYFQVETNGRRFNEADEWLITQVWLYSRLKNITFDAINFSFWEARWCCASDLNILASEISTQLHLLLFASTCLTIALFLHNKDHFGDFFNGTDLYSRYIDRYCKCLCNLAMTSQKGRIKEANKN